MCWRDEWGGWEMWAQLQDDLSYLKRRRELRRLMQERDDVAAYFGDFYDE
jgi:hypothetical protein